MLHHLLTQFSPTLLVSTLLLATYLAQQIGSPLLFLPAGIQLLAGFIYGPRCLPGCIIGIGLGTALLSQQPVTDSSLAVGTLIGALSTLCLLGLIHLTCRLSHINNDLAGLSYRHVVAIILLQAITDTTLRASLTSTPEQNLWVQLLLEASGNLLGSMTVAFSAWILAALTRVKDRPL